MKKNGRKKITTEENSLMVYGITMVVFGTWKWITMIFIIVVNNMFSKPFHHMLTNGCYNLFPCLCM